MSTARTLSALAGCLVFVGITRATVFDFSYTFSDGLVVSGALTGNQNGLFIENVSNVSVSFNGTPISGNVFTATFNGSDWVSGSVVSFDVFLNNFMFVNDDFANGGNAYDSLIWVLNGNVLENSAYAQADPLGVLSNDVPTEAARWSLAPSTVNQSVADDGTCAWMLTGTLIGLAGMQRRWNAVDRIADVISVRDLTKPPKS